MQITAGEIARIAGGKLLCGDPETMLRHIALDSRTMAGEDLFIPTKGERTDGHRFIESAFANGAAATLTSEHTEISAEHPYIAVPDTAAALQTLGRYMRGQYHGPVVGVTGSVGKTTTREMTKAALSAGGKVTGNEKNMNSQLGLPVTLCHMDQDAERAVLEMGISIPGEMKKLVAMGQPTLVLVTNIGIAHIETMGSREAICEEKMHIADFLAPDGTAVLNGDEPLLRAYDPAGRFRKVYYGMTEESDVYAKDVCLEGETSFTAVFKENVFGKAAEVPVTLSVLGAHNVMNALAALTAAALLGVDLKAAAAKLGEYGGFHRRLERLRRGAWNIIDDSYNANPVSMKAALEVLALTKAPQRVAVLADMLELGPETSSLHYEVGEYAALLPIDLFITYGNEITHLDEALRQAGKDVRHAENAEDAAALVKALAAPEAVILLKGSNGMKLGQVLERL